MSLETRLGLTRRDVPRTKTEEAPPKLRRLLHEDLLKRLGAPKAYQRVCDAANVSPEEAFTFEWSDKHLRIELDALDWLDVFKLVEDEAPFHRPFIRFDARYNEVLAETGMAYQVVNGRFQRLDAVADELDIPEVDISLLSGHLRPAGEQYQRAVHALRAVPTRTKDAIREAVGALEAVGKVITGSSNGVLSEVVPPLLKKTGNTWERPLAAAVGSLYGYASQVPGVRHGQYVDSEPSYAQAALTVRLSGAVIAYLIEEVAPVLEHPNLSWLP